MLSGQHLNQVRAPVSNQAINPRFVPFHLATLRGEVQLRLARERAAQIAAEEAEKTVRRRRAG